MKKGPFGKFAVDVDNGFEPYYVVDADKKKKVAELKRALKDADELYLATDEDREGEAIAWHLLAGAQAEGAGQADGVPRDHPRGDPAGARDAARPRRARSSTPRRPGASSTGCTGTRSRRCCGARCARACRPDACSPSRRGMVVERERERMAFRAAEYWDVKGTFAAAAPARRGRATARPFERPLVQLDGAAGRDRSGLRRPRRAARRGREVVHLDEAVATALRRGARRAPTSRVLELETKPYTRRPAAPFTTSTLQQEAARKLRMASRQTMRVAQGAVRERLHHLHADRLAGAVARRRSTPRVARPPSCTARSTCRTPPRVYASKSKGAQEAHEAIRPAGDHFRTPAQVARELSGRPVQAVRADLEADRRLADGRRARLDGVGAARRVGVVAPLGDAPTEAVFAASGTVITFRGFLAAYEEGRDAERYDDGDAARERTRVAAAADGRRATPLTALALDADGHRTSPPPRYTEASLVKALEERGIGRPSTYAATISVIQDRGYVTNRGQALVPSWLAFAVTRLLEENFDRLVDYDFTAEMEEDLDAHRRRREGPRRRG